MSVVFAYGFYAANNVIDVFFKADVGNGRAVIFDDGVLHHYVNNETNINRLNLHRA